MRIVCPQCKKTLADAPDDHPPRPFCSAQCKLLDLGNWLNEAYRVSEPIDPTEADLPESHRIN